jgi:hypothetical protein
MPQLVAETLDGLQQLAAVAGLLDPGGQPAEHAHRGAVAFAQAGSEVELQGVEMLAVIGPESVSAARRLKPQGPAEERLVRTT